MKRMISSAVCLISALVAADASAEDAWRVGESVDRMTDEASVFAYAEFTSSDASGFVLASCRSESRPSIGFKFKDILVNYDSDYSGSSIIRTNSVDYRSGNDSVKTAEASVPDDAESLSFGDDSAMKMARGIMAGRLLLRFWTIQKRDLVMLDVPVTGAADAFRRLPCFKGIVPPAPAPAPAPSNDGADAEDAATAAASAAVSAAVSAAASSAATVAAKQ